MSRGGRVDVDGAEIDDAGDLVAGEEDVVVPDVAQAGLQRNATSASGCELGNRARQGSWQHGEELAGQRSEFGPMCCR